MYGYSEGIQPTDLSIQEVFQLIPQEEIFGVFLKEPIIVDGGCTKYTAPYRNDENPGCFFSYNGDELRFVDFASGSSHVSENAIGFISKCTGLNYYESISFIVKYFNLGSVISCKANKGDTIKKINLNQYDDTIRYAVRKWDMRDKKFWFDRYEIKSEQLIFDKVYPISCYGSNSKKTGEPYLITPFDIAYAITDFPSGNVKIYRPYSKDYKWLTNCNQNDVGGITHLSDRNDQIIVTKSYKDYRVLTNIGLKCIWLQNEGMVPLSSILKEISKKTDKIVIWFDNDPVGQAAIKKVVEKFKEYHKNVHGLFLPPILLNEGIKDPSDLIDKKSLNELKEFCSNRKLL